jgi:hypothetical protein
MQPKRQTGLSKHNPEHDAHLNALLTFPNTIVTTDNWITSFSGSVMTTLVPFTCFLNITRIM